MGKRQFGVNISEMTYTVRYPYRTVYPGLLARQLGGKAYCTAHLRLPKGTTVSDEDLGELVRRAPGFTSLIARAEITLMRASPLCIYSRKGMVTNGERKQFARDVVNLLDTELINAAFTITYNSH